MDAVPAPPNSDQSDQPDYDWFYARTRNGRTRGPEVARALLDVQSSPDAAFASIRVVGTNGKGSTCAMLEAGLISAGVQTGRFTSPHLIHFEERIRVNGQEVAPARVAAFIRQARQESWNGAFFDLSLLLACTVFAESGVRVAVMEAGVGGVSDATQALQNVSAVALTNVALDHVGVLGSTVAQIARDKALAARPGVPLLTTATGEALEVIRAVCHEKDAPLYTPAMYPALFALPHAPALLGAHQHSNAALALATLRLLGHEAGAEAALAASHPARLERFVLDGKTLLIDGAHNPHATQALAAAVPRADVLLFGNLARKDTAATLAPLLAVAPLRVFTAPGDLATPPQDLAQQYGGEAVDGSAQALARALALTPAGGTLLVAGSLYLAGSVREWLVSGRSESNHSQ
ncbi:bifunctional folylpolyglutamate synthase/dihydrofolate synthase [Deinococcus sp. Arct2-2]|uniref:glutamate ligase domain-containing protein n=1 Tax=Deinococcus sp. Arct2-2 TaxID=2568653 RepID=UPI0010A567DF|nr:Mur ligase family protein [Deinococcus sp. Arct2-2]THF67666.1 bifunctional folylpolyglutamate synthase/dihydrofolate synthase [Deinococcus sp. Arct2-2]